MSSLTTARDQDTMRPDRAPFTETHRRLIDASIDDVWPAALDVTAREIRSFGPLIALRGLPSRLAGRHDSVSRTDYDRPLLTLFEDEGFVRLRQRDRGGDRSVEFGAVGRFWSLTGGQPVRFVDADEFSRFDEPGYARIWFEIRARSANACVEVMTTTCVTGTDRSAERRFAPYWAVIRLPSGLIRRSWLAGIDRRARR